MIRTITITGEGVDTVLVNPEVEPNRNGIDVGDGRQRLVTGGRPEARVEIPADETFIAYYDVDGTKLDWDPEEWEDDEDLTPQIVEHDFIEAPLLERVGIALVGACHEFEIIRKTTIVYRWKRKGGTSARGDKISGSTRLTGLLYDTLRADYLVWVAADHLRRREVTAWELEAILYHELSHLGPKKLRPHEFEGFAGELVRYGPVRYELQLAVSAVQRHLAPQQLPLDGVDA